MCPTSIGYLQSETSESVQSALRGTGESEGSSVSAKELVAAADDARDPARRAAVSEPRQ